MSDIELTFNTKSNEATMNQGDEAASNGGAASPDLAVLQQQAANLSAEDQKKIDAFISKIDIHDTEGISRYGEDAQRKAGVFSESALKSVRTKDLGEIGSQLTSLVTQIKGFKPDEEKKGLMGLIKKGQNRIAELKSQYDSVAANIQKVSDALEGHRHTLNVDITTLDRLFAENLNYYKELNMYILAGKRKLNEVRETELVELRDKARKSTLPEDAQRVNDLEAQLGRFEKRIYDLELTRTICIQMAPQIRLVQNNDSILAEKIQTSIVNTIPLWKNQMLLALGLEDSKRAMEAQRQVTEVTNELLKSNADKLKVTTIETAKEAERGIVDIETLAHANEQLITTIDEVYAISQEGRANRLAAEAELQRLENELKVKLIEVRNNSSNQ
ncbi:MAG: toxic anion resistance protein [Lachnospiraceae bacterium]|jgi:uncharacterized protein YaaN involved in tellurite resistance|nr:toxic anion resistance protein [Lachnospiraceae bacterium]